MSFDYKKSLGQNFLKDKNNKIDYDEYYKTKELFTKEVNTLFNFEKAIIEYYQTYIINHFHHY